MAPGLTVAVRAGRRRDGGARRWPLLAPAGVFILAGFIVPLGVLLAESLKGGGIARYGELLGSPVNQKVFWTTLRTAALTTLCCAALAYPYAYVMNRAGRKVRLVLLVAVLLPFWASLLVRSFAWIALLQDRGLINNALITLGLIDEPLRLIRRPLGVLIGMVHVMLPYMLLPLFNAMTKIDDRLLLAASSLGATPWRRFVRVFLPLSLPGLVAGVLLVFVLSLGFYITPALLGSPSQAMIGEIIATHVNHFGTATASALGIVLLFGTLAVLLLLAGVLRMVDRRTR